MSNPMIETATLEPVVGQKKTWRYPTYAETRLGLH